MKVSNLFKWILPKKTNGTVLLKDSSIKDILNFKKIENSTIDNHDINIGTGNTIDKSTVNKFYINIQQTQESQLTPDNSAMLTEKIKPIEEMIASGLTYKAIEAYNHLIYDSLNLTLSVNDRFTIYNGLLNCHVNINEDDEIIKSLIGKIESLGKVKEWNRFLYIQSVYYYNKEDIQKAIQFNNTALAYNSDYLNSILFKVFLESISNTIKYEYAIKAIISHPKYTLGTIKEIVNMKTVLGDISFHFKKYVEAIKFYEEGNHLNYSAHREFAIGVCYYSLAVMNMDEPNTIKLNEIDYNSLNTAIGIFNKLYNITDKELKKTLYKQLIPFYFNCLHLTQGSKEIVKISSEAKEYIDKADNDLMRIKAMAELSLGKYHEETIKNFTSEEQFKFEIFNLSEKGRHEELVTKLKPFVNDKYREDKHIQYAYLDSLLKVEEYDEFLAHYKRLLSVDPNDEPIKMLIVLYYEKTKQILKAKEILMDILKDSNDPFTILDSSRFLERNGYEQELGIVLKKVFNGEYKIREFDRSEFTKREFFHLFRGGRVQELCSLFNSLDKSKLNRIDYTQMSIEYYRLKGDFLNVALRLEELYNLTGNSEYYLRSAGYYFKVNDLAKTESILRFLSINKLVETSELYMLYSNLEVFHSNYEKAFEYAKKARKLDENNPKSISHSNFASISLRCNRVDDWMASMQEYITDYPNNGWIKAIKVIEEDKNGETKLTKEGEELFNSRNGSYQDLHNAFRTGKIGISTYIKYSGNNITQIIFHKNYYKLKLKITTGDITEVQEAAVLIKDEILIDSLSLFILAEADLLNLLDEYKTVYITYMTIESLQIILLNSESSYIRAVFDYINRSINIRYVPIDSTMILNFKRKEIYLEETIHCASYSYNNNIPFLNIDFTLRNSLGSKGKYLVNMVSMLRSIQEKDAERSKLISNAIIKLKQLQYDFINFNSIDLYNLSLTVVSKEDMFEKYKLYLSMDRNSDYISFIDVYIEFLRIVRKTVSNEKFLEYAEMIIKYIDGYIKKSKYYFCLLARIYPEYSEEICSLITKNNIVNLRAFEIGLNIYKGEAELIDIINSREFQRGKAIITACTRGIYSFHRTFSQNREEYDYYYRFLRKICIEFDVGIINWINYATNIRETK